MYLTGDDMGSQDWEANWSDIDRSQEVDHQPGLEASSLVSTYRHNAGCQHGWDRIFQTPAGFQDSDFFQKAVEKVLRCILSVIFEILGFRL